LGKTQKFLDVWSSGGLLWFSKRNTKIKNLQTAQWWLDKRGKLYELTIKGRSNSRRFNENL
jgi:hypothetical protein